jgi:hypothetical protein
MLRMRDQPPHNWFLNETNPSSNRIKKWLMNKAVATFHGVNWHQANPPIQGLESKMDIRGVRQVIVLA